MSQLILLNLDALLQIAYGRKFQIIDSFIESKDLVKRRMIVNGDLICPRDHQLSCSWSNEKRKLSSTIMKNLNKFKVNDS